MATQESLKWCGIGGVLLKWLESLLDFALLVLCVLQASRSVRSQNLQENRSYLLLKLSLPASTHVRDGEKS